MKKAVIFLIIIVCAGIGIGCGCGSKTDDKAETSENTYRLYCFNESETKLLYRLYEAEAAEGDTLVYELLDRLAEDYGEAGYSNVIKAPVEVTEAVIMGSRVYVYFNAEYYGMDSVREVFMRAAIVRTLSQINGIDYVVFYVGGEPLHNTKGIAVGAMRASDFIDDAGGDVNDYQRIKITLYFTDEQGTNLYAEMREAFIDDTSSREKLVLEQLLAGPETEGLKRVLPDGLTIISVTTKDGICYVNLDESFLTGSVNAVETVPVYAIVNSLTAIPGIDKVQILIKGESGKVYRETIALDSPLEARKDLVLVKEEAQ